MGFKPTHSLYERLRWLRFIGIYIPLVVSNSKSSFSEMIFPILMSPHVIFACAKTYMDVFVFICESAKVFHDLFKEDVATAGSVKCWEMVIYLRFKASLLWNEACYSYKKDHQTSS